MGRLRAGKKLETRVMKPNHMIDRQADRSDGIAPHAAELRT
jgi:hypothetical protein